MRTACTLAVAVLLFSPSTASFARETKGKETRAVGLSSPSSEKAERLSLRKERKERNIKKERSSAKGERTSKRSKAKTTD